MENAVDKKYVCMKKGINIVNVINWLWKEIIVPDFMNSVRTP